MSHSFLLQQWVIVLHGMSHLTNEIFNPLNSDMYKMFV